MYNNIINPSFSEIAKSCNSKSGNFGIKSFKNLVNSSELGAVILNTKRTSKCKLIINCVSW